MWYCWRIDCWWSWGYGDSFYFPIQISGTDLYPFIIINFSLSHSSYIYIYIYIYIYSIYIYIYIYICVCVCVCVCSYLLFSIGLDLLFNDLVRSENPIIFNFPQQNLQDSGSPLYESVSFFFFSNNCQSTSVTVLCIPLQWEWYLTRMFHWLVGWYYECRS